MLSHNDFQFEAYEMLMYGEWMMNICSPWMKFTKVDCKRSREQKSCRWVGEVKPVK